MDIRSKIRQILEQDEVEFRSNVAATDPVKGAPIRDPSLQSKKERQSTRDLIFKKLMSTDAYKQKIEEIGTITEQEKLNFVKELVQKKDILDKDSDEDYVEVLDDEIEHRQQMNKNLLRRANEAIKGYNDAVESHKSAFGAGLSTAYLTLPELRNPDDFKGLENFLANSPNIAKRFLSLVGIDVSSLKDEPVDEVSMDSRIDALSGDINRSNVPPRVKQQFLRRLNTTKKALGQGRDKIKTSQGPRVSIEDFFNSIQKDFEQVASRLMNEQTGINAPNPQKAEDTINRYMQWLTSGQNYRSLPNIINALEELIKSLKAIEINKMLIAGFQNKKQKLLNLRNKGQEVQPEEIEMIVLDPNDFPVDEDEPIDTLQEVKIMAESKEETPNEEFKGNYKRQRTITRKFKLKEIWKQQQNNILGKKVEEEKVDTGPDLHLGDMG